MITTTHTLVSIIVALICAVIAALYIAREAYNRGQQSCVANMQRALVETRKAAQRRQQDAVSAMEQAETRHADELAQLRSSYHHRIKVLENDLQSSLTNLTIARDDMIQLEQRRLTASEINLVEAMVEKLRLGSAALHSTQQFADARQAKELAGRGETLLKRLRTAGGAEEAAA